MEDEAYVSVLLAVLTNPNPAGISPNDPYGQADDGIDRYDGFGRDVWVESMEVTAGDHGAELMVVFGLAVPEEPALQGIADRGSVRLPFDREWRQLSGYEDPAEFAPEVARQVIRALGCSSHPRQGSSGPVRKARTRASGPAEPRRAVADAPGCVEQRGPSRGGVARPGRG